MIQVIKEKILNNTVKKSNINTDKTENTQQEKKNGKKKLALALTALAVAGAATVVGINMIKKGKVNSLSIDDFKKIGKFEKGNAFVKGKPYSGTIDVINTKGKYQLEYINGQLKSSTHFKVAPFVDKFNHKKLEKTGIDIWNANSKKIYSQKDGIKTVEKFLKWSDKWKLAVKSTIQDGKIEREHIGVVSGINLKDVATKNQDGTWNVLKQKTRLIGNGLHSGYAIDTTDAKTGKVVNSKIGGTLNKIRKGKGGTLRKTFNETNEAGNKVAKTFVNGNLATTSETILNPDGSKRIIIDYLKGHKGKVGREIIDIAKNGTKTITQKAKRIFSM